MAIEKGSARKLEKAVSGIMLTLLLTNMLTLAINIQPVKASATIYIRADGSVDPLAAPIQRDGDIYTFTDNIYDTIVVERSNVILDGAGYTLQGSGSGNGFYWYGINNVTIQNINIRNFSFGICLYYSSNNTLTNNTLNFNDINGICVIYSDNNEISNNFVKSSGSSGIYFNPGSNNEISNNTICQNNGYGIRLWYSPNNEISSNFLEDNGGGIFLGYPSTLNNKIWNNNIWESSYGVSLYESSNNIIYHNNFVDNTEQVYSDNSTNTWDDGYPSGGNYWSDYTGVDELSGPNQDQPGSDGIGDVLYIIDESNIDHYPLMNRYMPLGFQAGYSTNLPLIDGGVTDAEWNDANSYEIILREYQGVGTVRAGVYFKHDSIDIYIGLKVFAGQHDFDQFIVYFDEGDDGGYGSGTCDGILTFNQEDLKACFSKPIEGYKIEDGCYKHGHAGAAWYGYWGGDFNAECSFVLDHWECEFSIPFIGNDGGVDDVSDLICTVSDTIGIKIQYFTQPGAVNYFYPKGSQYSIRNYTTLSFERAPDFSIMVSPTSLTIQQGNSDTSVITITSTNGFNQPVQLTVSGAPILKWTFEAASTISGTLAVGSDSIIYYGSYNNKLYAINPNGVPKWIYDVGDIITSSCSLGPDGTIYFLSYYNDELHAIYPDGAHKWSYNTSWHYTGWCSSQSPAIGMDSTIYCGYWGTRALYPNGTLRWTLNWFLDTPYAKRQAFTSFPAIGPDGTVYVGVGGCNLSAVNPDGTLKWNYYTGGNVTGGYLPCQPATGPDGTVYFASFDGKLCALNSNGTLKWSYELGTIPHSNPVVAPNGDIYLGSWEGKLYALSSSGTLKWSFNIMNRITSPAIGEDGTLYCGSGNGELYALSPNGKLVWSFKAGGGISSPPVVGQDNTVYFGCGDGNLYAIGSLEVTTTLNPEQVTPPPDGSATSTLTISVGTTATDGSYTLTVTGTNGTLTHNVDISLEITTVPPPDTTPPTTPVVTDDGEYTSSTAWLHAIWSSSDSESGIAEYQYAISTSPGGTDVVDWTSAGTATEVTHSGLNLIIGGTYYFSVKAKNGKGLWSEIGTSDGITVTTITFDLSPGWGSKELFVPIFFRSREDPGTIVLGVHNRRDMWYLVKVYKRTPDNTWMEIIPDEFLKGAGPYLGPWSEKTFLYTPQMGDEIKIQVWNDMTDGTLMALWSLDFVTRFLTGIRIPPKFLEYTDWQTLKSQLNDFYNGFVKPVKDDLLSKAWKKAFTELCKAILKAPQLYSSILVELGFEPSVGAGIIVTMRKFVEVAFRFFAFAVNIPTWWDFRKNLQKEPFMEEVIFTKKYRALPAVPNLRVTKSLAIIQKEPYYVGQTIDAQFTITNKGTAPITFNVLTVGGRGPKGNEDVRDFTLKTDITMYPGDSYNYEGELKLLDSDSYHFFIAYQTSDGKWETSVPTEAGTVNTLDITVNPIPERWIAAELGSPGELRVYDSQNRVTGLVSGEEKNEIPYSTYCENIVVILAPADSYRYEVAGTGEGLYSLTVINTTEQEIATFNATDIPTSSNTIHQYTIDWSALSQSEEGVTVKVDSDGDSAFEKIFTAGSELTRDEFMLQVFPEAFPMWIAGVAVAATAIVTIAIAAFWRRRKHPPTRG